MTKPKLYQFTNHENYHGKEILLDKIAEDKFRVLEFGNFKPILMKGYVLIENSIAEIICKLVPEQIISAKKISIWRKSTDETYTNYTEIELQQHLNLENFKNAEHNGLQIYLLLYGAIYVSPELKDRIITELPENKEFTFINEWPMYA